MFDTIEYHADKEMFLFLQGTAIMLLCDIQDGKPLMDSVQIVRIPSGSVVEIAAGKGHFVAVAESERYDAVVISPVQDAPRLALAEPVTGIQ